MLTEPTFKRLKQRKDTKTKSNSYSFRLTISRKKRTYSSRSSQLWAESILISTCPSSMALRKLWGWKEAVHSTSRCTRIASRKHSLTGRTTHWTKSALTSPTPQNERTSRMESSTGCSFALWSHCRLTSSHLCSKMSKESTLNTRSRATTSASSKTASWIRLRTANLQEIWCKVWSHSPLPLPNLKSTEFAFSWYLNDCSWNIKLDDLSLIH